MGIVFNNRKTHNQLIILTMKVLSKLNAMLLAACAVLFTACEKEQTSFEVGDIPGRATVVGLLTYSQGQGFENGKYIELYKNAAGVTVQVEVNNSDYKTNSTGKTVYSTTTGEDGKFSISFPATTNGVETTIRVLDKAGKFTILDQVNNGAPVFKELDGFYKLSTPTTTVLKPGDIEVFDNVLEFESRGEYQEFKEHSVFEVVVGNCVFSGMDRVFDFAYGTNVYLNVVYGTNENSIERTFAATTDRNGSAKFDLPFPKLPYTVKSINITADRTWEDRYNYDGQYYSGYYQLDYSEDYGFKTYLSNVTFSEFEQMYLTTRVRMEFHPTGYNPELNGKLDADLWYQEEMWPDR